MGKYDMDIVEMRLRDLVSPDYNPRVISDSEFRTLKRSIVSFGYNDPIIVNKRNNHIVAGNQRYRALLELDKESHGRYSVIKVVLVDIPLDDEKAFNIGHNKIGGEFDKVKLQSLLDELESVDYDMNLTGFLDEVPDLDVEEDLPEINLEEDLPPLTYSVTVSCENKTQQEYLLETLRKQGYKVKSMTY